MNLIKVVYRSLKPKGRSKAVRRKTVTNSAGQAVKMLTIDASSKNFGQELRQIFKANVIVARHANTANSGFADVPERDSNDREKFFQDIDRLLRVGAKPKKGKRTKKQSSSKRRAGKSAK